MIAQFHRVADVTSARDRLYHPEMYRKGDLLQVGLSLSMGEKWLVVALNEHGEKVNGIVNRCYGSEEYARKIARRFAEDLGQVIRTCI